MCFAIQMSYCGYLECCCRGKRLILVLDLDMTLLESVMLDEVVEEERAPLRQLLVQQRHLPYHQRTLYCFENLHRYVKLRPGVREFLAAIKHHFQLWILTNANL